ncbi:MAG: secondary thiamine-phosphate synthase enzyme YjbQ [Anaerolineales bacterium]|nr:secondary thiamine-phosphate synthase enzyme YjbQ [Anaerolineales bacterium]
MDPSALDRQVGRSQRGCPHTPAPSRGRPPHPTLLPKPTILPAPGATLTVKPGRLIQVEIPAPDLQANLLGHPAYHFLAIALPPSYYQSGRSYPVVYFLPRFGDDERAFANGNYGIVLPRTVDAVMAGGSVRELIVVVVKGRSAAGGSFYVNSPLTGNWEGFVVRDVVTYVDRMCRALAHPDWRGIAGHSIGGFGALQLAMSHPKTFGAVYGLSPGLFAPGGLEESQIFRDPLANDDLLAMIGQLRDPDAEKAAAMFKAALPRLTGDERFTLAYGMAFAPEVLAAPPYIEFPYEQSGTKLRTRAASWARWEAGFGDLAAKLAAHRQALSEMRGIGMAHGWAEECAWIPAGCLYSTDVLLDNRIQHRLVSFDGGTPITWPSGSTAPGCRSSQKRGTSATSPREIHTEGLPTMRSYRKELWFELPDRRGFINITPQVEACLDESGIREGLTLVNAMHITASVFINDDESGLHHDYDAWLEGLAPHAPTGRYQHNRTGEDNADAHLKRQVMGREVVVAVTHGAFDFGPWEQIFYGEFDGRRRKRVLVKIIGE